MKKLEAVFTMAAIVVSSGEIAWARTWHVKLDGSGDAPTIQAAIDLARAGDDVLVSAGTYTWTTEGASGESMLRLKAGLWLHSEAGASATFLDAETRGRVIIGQDVGEVRIEGFTIQNGLLMRFAAPHGAGIYILGNSTPRIADCVIRDNVLSFDNVSASGGGVFCGAASFNNCVFSGNSAHCAGTARGAALRSESASLSRCVFEFNSAGGASGIVKAHGGAVAEDGVASISECTFRNNRATADGGLGSFGGALSLAAGGGTVADCLFQGELAIATSGGARGGAIFASGSVTIRRCIFVGNRAVFSIPAAGPAHGGAIYCDAGGSIENCTLVGNSATSSEFSSGTGAIHTGGTVQSTIVTETTGGSTCSGAGTWICCDLYGNTGGDQICGTDGGGNFSADPRFCSSNPATSLNFSLRRDSPCAPADDPPAPGTCGLIGAVPVGCETALTSETWTSVRRRYR